MKKHITIKAMAALLALSFGLFYGIGLLGGTGTEVSLTDLSGERSALVDAAVQGALTDGSFAQNFSITAEGVSNRLDPLETQWMENYHDVTPMIYPGDEISELETQSFGSYETIKGVCDTLQVYLLCSEENGECVIPTDLTKTARPGATFCFSAAYDTGSGEAVADWNYLGEYLRGSYEEPLPDGFTDSWLSDGQSAFYSCGLLSDVDGSQYAFVSPPEEWGAADTRIYQVDAVQGWEEWIASTSPDLETAEGRTVRSTLIPRGSWELVAQPPVVNGTVLGVHQTEGGLVILTQKEGLVQVFCVVDGEITDSTKLLQLETNSYTKWQMDVCPQQFASDAGFVVRYWLKGEASALRSMSFATALRIKEGRFDSCQTVISGIDGKEIKVEQGTQTLMTENRPGFAFCQVQLNGAGDLVTVEQLCVGGYQWETVPEMMGYASVYDYNSYGGETTLSVRRAGELTYCGEITSTRLEDAKKFGGAWWSSQSDEIRMLTFSGKACRDRSFSPTRRYLTLSIADEAEAEAAKTEVAE